MRHRAEFLWVPDWSKGPSFKPSGVAMGHVVDASPCVRNMQVDCGEEVESAAVQKIYDLALDKARPGDKGRFVRSSSAMSAKPRIRFPFVQPTPPHALTTASGISP